ncbi:hypothetical protein PHYBLDRAFT_160460 [Phycomyces blakesleeanus NRRL 1555(-)]|uniref:Uncharacterized protein n=1 Tax=Phycomyces blakesleeanus (strain ATCC 8743b / DSM 1359 / FGSC 10004 / NBRC 33097 / NRRL 1555) TaxID=763407 RepID=A0A167K6H0_PHYB8|nr:hypothetical protein PHYBLDRAFT_160460 [Phycomyces blakesleeanus NRRL 1555(-)]OAD67368.1 hypothetical protein PHYBLDRAFT_160460 [Phycomyces blakesleeanus NRRL 1555(-)]|eukprot:XP_018285408.1 hypothetical protein PHYBLDRAFT_160460 [Phycomyces blakesleeanus NRRL 1555(-)]
MELAQKNAFKAQQKLEELEEVVEHTEYQIKSLKRQKSLAVESGQFQNAAIAAERIKSSQNLLESVSKKRDTQHEESKHCQSILCEYKDEMSKLEKEYKELIKLAGTSIIEILENAKSSLQKANSLLLHSNYPGLHVVINHEIEKIAKHIQSAYVYLQNSSDSSETPLSPSLISY